DIFTCQPAVPLAPCVWVGVNVEVLDWKIASLMALLVLLEMNIQSQDEPFANLSVPVLPTELGLLGWYTVVPRANPYPQCPAVTNPYVLPLFASKPKVQPPVPTVISIPPIIGVHAVVRLEQLF